MPTLGEHTLSHPDIEVSAEERRIAELLAKSFNFSVGLVVDQVWYLVWKEQHGEPIFHITREDLKNSPYIQEYLYHGFMHAYTEGHGKKCDKAYMIQIIIRETMSVIDAGSDYNRRFDISNITEKEIPFIARSESLREKYKRKD